MNDFRTRLQSSSLGVLFVVFTAFYFIGTYGFALLDHDSRLTLRDALIRLATAAVFGGVMTAVSARQRRRSGGIENITKINRSLKTGIVPEDAEPAIWIPVLQRRLRQNRQARWMNPLVFGLFTLLGVYLLTQEPGQVIPWIITVFFVAAGVLTVVLVPRTIRRINALLAQLESRPSAVSGLVE